MRRDKIGVGIATAVVITMAVTTPVQAADKDKPDKQTCVDAATRAQIQRDDGKLRAAVEAFKVCSASTCPVAVRKSCSEWLEEWQKKIPSVTVHSEDTGATSLTIDGNSAPLDTPQQIDPGRHTVKVEYDGNRKPFQGDVNIQPSETKTVLARAHVDPPPPPPKITRPIPVPVFVLGGVFVLGVASWATFGLMAKSDTDQLEQECAPACKEEDKDSAYTKALVADISLGVGILAAAGAAYFFFTRPTKVTPVAPSSGSTSIRIGLGTIRGEF
jgi:hypothetical protein